MQQITGEMSKLKCNKRNDPLVLKRLKSYTLSMCKSHMRVGPKVLSLPFVLSNLNYFVRTISERPFFWL